MKQIKKDKICSYCLGCIQLEIEMFEGVRNCKNFIAGIDNWQELMRKVLKESKDEIQI